MDFRKIDLNKMKLCLSEGDIISFIEDLTYSFDEIADQRSMELEFSSDTEHIIAWFDESIIEKVMCNLLSNSFKYTPDLGKIQVKARLVPNPAENIQDKSGIIQSADFLELRIIDNGIGMPEDYANHLFERFNTIEKHDPNIKRGTGIGLALTKELVELHKGSITIESEEKKGTQFIVSLPLIKDPGPSGGQLEVLTDRRETGEYCRKFVMKDDYDYSYRYSRDSSAYSEDKNKPVLLVVEDDPEVRNFIRESFGQNFSICEAADGKEGLDVTIKDNPDIIISDILMPVMDGIKMCQEIKSDIRTSHIPVILLTAKSSLESRIEGLETGADAYIEKPFSTDLLGKQVANILENRKLLREKFSKELIVQPSEITITSVDAIFLKKAIDLVEKHLSDSDFSSGDFCREIGMSRSQLHRKLKNLTSQPASEFIRTLRLKRAASLLIQSQLSVEEISYKVGFRSPAYFTKCFKTTFGKTPTEYIHKKA